MKLTIDEIVTEIVFQGEHESFTGKEQQRDRLSSKQVAEAMEDLVEMVSDRVLQRLRAEWED